MGGVAYDLTTKFCEGYVNWTQLFEMARNQLDTGQFFDNRWLNILIEPEEFDVIIRGTGYINDNYFIYGSYRATFHDLYGPGDSGYAWDGFVMMIPAWNIHQRFTGVPDSAQWQPSNGYYIYPCRYPFTLPPGAADSVTINDDSTPGVYSIAPLLGSNVSDAEGGGACGFFLLCRPSKNLYRKWHID